MKILVSSTVGQKIKRIESFATNWKSLKSELTKEGYDLSSVQAVVGETQNTLVQDEAVLPLTDFTLFIVPVKTKSGADLSYKDARAKIKEIKAVASDEAFKAAFGDYTHSSTVELNALINKWSKNTKQTIASAPILPRAKAAIEKMPVAKAIAPKKVEAPVVKEEVEPIAALVVPEVTVSFSIPIGLIPAGIYTVQLTEDQLDGIRAKLK